MRKVKGRRRGEVEIMRDVLKACLRGANKTKIVYGTNLNFSRLERYLKTLLGLGFVVEENDSSGSVMYKTTQAGIEFFNRCLKNRKGFGKVPEVELYV